MDKSNSKNLRKVFLWLAVLVAALVLGGMVLSRVAEKKLHAALAQLPVARVDFKKVNLSPVLGNLEFRDVDFAIRDTANAGADIEVRVGALKLDRLSWSRLLHGEAHAMALVIRDPQVRMVLTGVAENKDSAAQAPAPSFLKKVSVSEIRVENGSIGLTSQIDSMKLAAQGIGISVRDIGILLAENRVEYNDSTYSVSLDSLDFVDGEGLSRIQIGHLATADAGPVEALAMHLYSSVPKEALAVRMGKVAAMWYDVKLDSLCTSPLNIPRMVGSGEIGIDSVRISGPEIVLLQDDRFPPPAPYPTMQEGLNTMTMPLQIRQVSARIKAFTFIWETTHVNRGAIAMHDLHLAAKSVSNAPDNVMELDVKSGFTGKSQLDLSLFIRNDRRESTHGRLRIYNLEASRLDPFIRPLFGATAKADIHQIDSRFKGGKHKMTNNFCMLYDNLSIQAWNDSTAPFKIVAQNSGVVTFLANVATVHSNPSAPGKDPKTVEVMIERDPMLPYPSYIIQNLTMGMLRTVLPGGSVRKPKG